MKSLYARILLWCLGTLLASLLAFNIISRVVEFRAVGKGGPFARVESFLLQKAIEAYESGGAPKLVAYLQQVDTSLGQQRYLTDPQGRDLVTGTDRSSLLTNLHSQWLVPVPENGHMIVAQPSPDNRYRLITILDPPIRAQSLVLYFLLIAGAVALVCWALAVSIVSPLRDLARSVEQFGRGDLSVRLRSRRQDEIGELSRSFDRMAERIGTLVTAERRLLQDVSHELRSPLARMSFALELARREKNRDSALARIKHEIERLSDLVASLLQVTRSEGDPLARRQEAFHIADLLHEIADDCGIEADARNCHVVIHAEANPNMVGDQALLRRALENIVRNAIRYAPADSAIEVALGASEESARISVRDYGVGVPEECVDKLCQPFFRVDDSRNGATGGVGLGLAIAQRAIGIHEGSLRVENANPGLSVSIELPLAR
ncbi:MAG: ATP-binding protein [Acidobacteriota bacterium]|nr:ATP-binding protein [Acidobacteriota bacterium]